MNNSPLLNAPYLRTSRSFIEDVHQISVELNKAYLDIANAVNSRTLGLFPSNKPIANGESWFFDRNQKQQGFRQIYSFISTANIPHGIIVDEISAFTKCTGSFVDNGGNWNGLIFASPTAIAGQISFNITTTNIVFHSGAGAPTLVSGIIVLEWLSDV